MTEASGGGGSRAGWERRLINRSLQDERSSAKGSLMTPRAPWSRS